jgi:transcriptional regulator GlxA family with amidase domain
VPGAFAVDDVTRDRGLVQWVKKRAPSCRRVCSVCIGSFLLAAAGILNARRAATHWMHASLLASRYPQCNCGTGCHLRSRRRGLDLCWRHFRH